MKDVLGWGCAVLLLAGCGGRPRTGPGAPRPARGAAPAATASPAEGGSLTAKDLGPDRRAKTVEWIKIGTPEGTPYLAGAVVLDRALRSDADDLYSVELRLRNMKPETVECEVRILFLLEDGHQVLGIRARVLDPESEEGWVPVALEPYGLATVSDAARVPGAAAFELRVRPPGGKSEGKPDAGK